MSLGLAIIGENKWSSNFCGWHNRDHDVFPCYNSQKVEWNRVNPTGYNDDDIIDFLMKDVTAEHH